MDRFKELYERSDDEVFVACGALVVDSVDLLRKLAATHADVDFAQCEAKTELFSKQATLNCMKSRLHQVKRETELREAAEELLILLGSACEKSEARKIFSNLQYVIELLEARYVEEQSERTRLEILQDQGSPLAKEVCGEVESQTRERTVLAMALDSNGNQVDVAEAFPDEVRALGL